MYREPGNKRFVQIQKHHPRRSEGHEMLTVHSNHPLNNLLLPTRNNADPALTLHQGAKNRTTTTRFFSPPTTFLYSPRVDTILTLSGNLGWTATVFSLRLPRTTFLILSSKDDLGVSIKEDVMVRSDVKCSDDLISGGANAHDDDNIMITNSTFGKNVKHRLILKESSETLQRFGELQQQADDEL